MRPVPWQAALLQLRNGHACSCLSDFGSMARALRDGRRSRSPIACDDRAAAARRTMSGFTMSSVSGDFLAQARVRRRHGNGRNARAWTETRRLAWTPALVKSPVPSGECGSIPQCLKMRRGGSTLIRPVWCLGRQAGALYCLRLSSHRVSRRRRPRKSCAETDCIYFSLRTQRKPTWLVDVSSGSAWRAAGR